MQCFAIPFKPLGPKMTKTVSCSNTIYRITSTFTGVGQGVGIISEPEIYLVSNGSYTYRRAVPPEHAPPFIYIRRNKKPP